MDKDLRRTLGNAARAARKALGLTQDKVAERLDVSVEFYGRIERGVGMPSIEVLDRMVAALEVSADSLLGIDNARAPRPASLTRPDDPPELMELMAMLSEADPSVVHLVNSLVRGLERVEAARASRNAEDTDAARP